MTARDLNANDTVTACERDITIPTLTREPTTRESAQGIENVQIELFERDGRLYSIDPYAVDYYHVNEQGQDVGSWIHPALNEWAESIGCYWDWENPEAIVLSH